MPDATLSNRSAPLARALTGALALILSLAFVAPALASGGGASSAPSPATTSEPAEPEDPRVVAARHYNMAVRLRERAVKLEAELPLIEVEKKRAKTKKKIDGSYRNAERELRSAVQLNPSFHQAYSDLGFALRKQGNYDDALRAYDTALGLAPGYPEAIEYRGEAFLGLGRVDDAKDAYMQLFEGHRDHADALLDAMKHWVHQRGDDPAGIDATTVEAFAEWVASREQVARQVPPLGEQQARLWGR